MKNYFNRIKLGAGIFLVFLLLLSSCSNVFSREELQKSDSQTYILISQDSISFDERSIRPTQEYAFENLKNIYLYAQKSGGTRKNLLSNVENLTNVYAKQILLNDGAGSYTFELYGSLDSVCFYQKLENVIIEESKTNKISFELSPVKSSADFENSFEDYGGIKIKLNFEDSNVGKTVITVVDLATNEKVDEKTITLYSSYGTRSVEYERNATYTSETSDTKRIATGTYRVTFDFYCTSIQAQTKTNGETETVKYTQLLNSLPYIVHVEKGRNSILEDTIDLNEVYTITYKYNYGSQSGGLAEGYTTVNKYSRKSENIVLPLLYRAYYLFDGWYTAESGGERITNIPTGSSGDITVYARWKDLGASGTDAVLYVNPSAAYHYGTSKEYGLANLSEALYIISKSTAVYYHNWTIKIKGSDSGSYSIDDDVYSFKTYTDSITLEGISTPVDGLPVDEINAGFTLSTENGYVLSVTTKNPVTIKNLKITGGNNSGNGGGIYVGSAANVTLAEGTLIFNNTAEYGGGLYVDGGTVNIEENAKIDSCSAKNGGGVYIESGTVTVKGESYSAQGPLLMDDDSVIANCTLIP
ncbi:MAG: InlB B-repeat-containing protein [Treponema sp.]|nr:InlB B-repeat-containing protein [Treponema sp.]